MIPASYNLKSAHFVNMEDRYAINGCLLGKRIPVHYSEHCYLLIIFPSILQNESYPYLGVEKSIDRYGMEQENWGKIYNYVDISKLGTVTAWISSVIVECYSDENNLGLSSDIIQKQSKQLLSALRVINPDSLRTPTDNWENTICEVNYSVEYKEGKLMPGFMLSMIFDDREGVISFRDIKFAIRK